jgi:hypothetical protein
MAILIQDINFTTSDIISDKLNGIQGVSFSVYETVCNHISAPGLEGYFFDFSNVIRTETLNTGVNYGLIVNNNNNTFRELNISY